MKKLLSLATVVAFSLNAATSFAEIRITEWMYTGNGGEFIELTNVGNAPIDMNGWSYDDDTRIPGEFDLSAFGLVQPGESVVFTEDQAEVFRTSWGLGPQVKIIGDLGLPNANGIGRNDALVLFDSGSSIVDQLVYGDQDFPLSIRAQNTSGWVSASGVAQNDPYEWDLSSVADAQTSYQSTSGDTGSPGAFSSVGTLPGTLPSLVITEYLYTGEGGEFIEFTNLSSQPVDVAGWSFDDDNFGAGYVPPFDISAFGTIVPGESVILTETPEAAFRLDWNLSPTVKVIGDYALPNGANIGRVDEINIFDATDTLVDRLNYGDEVFLGSIRTQDISGNPNSPAVLGANDVTQWSFSSVGDSIGSYAATHGDVCNPGTFAVVPEPATALLTLLAGGIGLSVRRR
jgi:predicted extracellular nuclease